MTVYQLGLLLLWGGSSVCALAQTRLAPTQPRRDTITIENSSGKTEVRPHGPGLWRYAPDVRLRHQGLAIHCDVAVMQRVTGRVIARGNVQVTHGDSLSIRSDSILYDGLRQQLTLLGRVVFKHRQAELATTSLMYNLPTGLVRYAGNSRLADGPNVLVSQQGYYNTRTRRFMAYRQVVLTTPLATQRADSLLYTLADNPTPAVDFAQATSLDETELTRHLPNRKTHETVTARPASTSAKPAKVNSTAAVQTLPRPAAPAMSAAAPPVRKPSSFPAPSDEESELERRSNRPPPPQRIR